MIATSTFLNKTSKQRANIKATEIAKLRFGTFTQDGIKVEVQDIKKITGGVEIMARAWKGTTQLGFGKDGSVDIERFNIYNPPILVDDPTGTIVRTQVDADTGQITERKLKEDPLQAIKEALAHIIKVANRKGRIVKGRIGNTTSTFYPVAGDNEPWDARLYHEDLTGMTIAQVNAAAGTNAFPTPTADRVWHLRGDGNTDQFDRVSRSDFGFTISSIGTDIIDSVILSLYGSATTSDGLNTGASVNSVPVVVDGTPANEAVSAASDFALLGSVDFGRGPILNNWSTAGYNDIILNASGIAHAEANKAGNVFYGTMVGFDFDQTITGLTWADNLVSQIFAFHADDAGTTRDPKLVIVHAAVETAYTITGTGASDSTVGTVAWSNPTNIQANDGSVATAILGSSAQSEYIKATNFGFAIPTGATINGIEVRIYSKGSVGGPPDPTMSVLLVKGGTIQSAETKVTTTWNTIFGNKDVGGAADLWTNTWTAADINNSGFGMVGTITDVVGGETFSIDYIQIKVSYTSDTLVETTGWSGGEGMVVQNDIVWRTPLIGYVFVSNTNIDLAYKKTTDGGATWGTAVDVFVGTVVGFAIWDKEWTTGTKTDTLIHIAFIDSGTGDVSYNSLDTSSDTFTYTITTPKTIFNGVSASTGGIGSRSLSIVEAQSGYLYSGGRINSTGENFFYRSTDTGATWISRAALMDGNTDLALLTPGNVSAGDTNDIWVMYFDLTNNELSLKEYDNSLNSFTETSIVTGMTGSANSGMGAAHRLSDGHTIATIWSELDTATADLKVFDVGSNSSITTKTDVISNTSEAVASPIMINQQNDDLYVAYAKGGVWGATVDIYYKKSTDGGTTWSAETNMSLDLADDHRIVWSGNSVGDNGGMFYPTWWNDDNSDVMANADNAVSIAQFVAPTVTFIPRVTIF